MIGVLCRLEIYNFGNKPLQSHKHSLANYPAVFTSHLIVNLYSLRTFQRVRNTPWIFLKIVFRHSNNLSDEILVVLGITEMMVHTKCLVGDTYLRTKKDRYFLVIQNKYDYNYTSYIHTYVIYVMFDIRQTFVILLNWLKFIS